MTLRFKILASTAVLSLITAIPVAAQSSDLDAEFDALVREMQELEAEFNTGSPYGQTQAPYSQNPYGQTQNPYGQNPYGQAQSPYNQPQSPYVQDPYGQNPYGQTQNPYGQQNPFSQTQQPAKIPGAQSVQIMDTQNPQGRPMVATTRQIPTGWQASGGINWRQNNNPYCGLMTPHIKWTAYSPDRKSQIDIWPEEIFAGVANPQLRSLLGNCPNIDIINNRAFATAFVQKHRPGARITDIIEPTPAEQAQLQTAAPPVPPSGDPSMRQRYEVNAAQVRSTYSENGQSYDEVAYIAWISVHTTQAPMMGFGGMQIHNTVTIPTFTMRAPSGQLDISRAEAFFDTDRPNPVHQQMTKQYHDQKARQTSKRLIAESKARMAANRRSPSAIGSSNPVGDIIASGGPESGRSPYGQARTIDGIRGVTTYNDPNSMTGTMETQIGQGGYVYRQDDGSYVQTDDPSYGHGTQLDPQ